MDISLIGSPLLRLAIRQNLVSFPSQVPTLTGRQGRDTPERAAELYFVRDWPVKKICDRFDLSKAMVQKMLSQWRIRAIAAGYVQAIYPETLEALVRTHHARSDEEESRQGGVFPTTILVTEPRFDSGVSLRVTAPPSGEDRMLSAVQGF
jgi:hypothetical protein